MVQLNNSATTIPDFNNLPVKTINGATIYMRDIRTPTPDGFPRLTVIVHVDGNQRGSPPPLIRTGHIGDPATLDIVKGNCSGN